MSRSSFTNLKGSFVTYGYDVFLHSPCIGNVGFGANLLLADGPVFRTRVGIPALQTLYDVNVSVVAHLADNSIVVLSWKQRIREVVMAYALIFLNSPASIGVLGEMTPFSICGTGQVLGFRLHTVSSS